jgi:hypothetical protein
VTHERGSALCGIASARHQGLGRGLTIVGEGLWNIKTSTNLVLKRVRYRPSDSLIQSGLQST